MLVLTRKKHEVIQIGQNITIMVVAIEGGKVRLGITAPRGVPVHRQEVAEAIARELENGSGSIDTGTGEAHPS